jgi:hypothetical protein
MITPFSGGGSACIGKYAPLRGISSLFSDPPAARSGDPNERIDPTVGRRGASGAVLTRSMSKAASSLKPREAAALIKEAA